MMSYGLDITPHTRVLKQDSTSMNQIPFVVRPWRLQGWMVTREDLLPSSYS